MNIDVLSLVLGIIIGFGIAAGAVLLKRAYGLRVVYRDRARPYYRWRRGPR
jgi:hypothetical protein